MSGPGVHRLCLRRWEPTCCPSGACMAFRWEELAGLLDLVRSRYCGTWDVQGFQAEVLDLAERHVMVTHGEPRVFHGAVFAVIYSGTVPERLQRLGFALQGSDRTRLKQSVRAMYARLRKGEGV